MNLNFNEIPETIDIGFKGGEGAMHSRLFVDGLNKLNYGMLEPGASLGFHKHETNSEIIFVLEGEATFRYDDGTEVTKAGECHYCPMGHSHCMMNKTEQPLRYFAVIPEHAPAK